MGVPSTVNFSSNTRSSLNPLGSSNAIAYAYLLPSSSTSISNRIGTSVRPPAKSLGFTRSLTWFVPRAILWRISSASPTVVFPEPFRSELKPHRHVRASASEILRLHQIAYLVRTSGDPLEDFQRKSNRCLPRAVPSRSEEHTSELQSLRHLVCRLL